MSVSKKDREDYQERLRDRKKSTVDQVVGDLSGNHPDSEPYYKARRGEQLDKDKKKQS